MRWARGGFLVVLQLIERDAEIAQRRGIFGSISIARRACFGGELRPAGEPKHLAEIGVKQRHLRRKLDRALHVLDSLAELAVLVRDDAEQMLGLGQVRLRLEDVAADRFGLQQPALAAAALGINERFAKRHEVGVTLPRSLVHGRFRYHARRRTTKVRNFTSPLSYLSWRRRAACADGE